MAQKEHTCRHCAEPFVSSPTKPGYIDECPECLVEKTMKFEHVKRAHVKTERKRATVRPVTLEALMEYIAAHPVTVNVKTGAVVKEKTRLELQQRLKKKGYSPATIEKLVFAYMEPFEE